MSDLTAFLNARLDEDEAAAKAAAKKRRPPWRAVSNALRGIVESAMRGAQVADVPGDALAEHIARHDPARVLREAEAKRKILADLTRRAEKLQVEFGDTWFTKILGPLAAVYSDHPDYQEAWNAPTQPA